MQPLLCTSVDPVWGNLRVARGAVREVLAGYRSELVEAAEMTSCELLENAIKYGVEVPGALAVSFAVDVIDGAVRIVTTNGCTDAASVDRLRDRVRAANAAEDKAELYLSRLQELLSTRGEGTHLGIYRIAFEGGFDLECAYENQIVTVTADRKIHG